MSLEQQLEHCWKQAVLPPGAAKSRREIQTISEIPWTSSSERVSWSRENASRADVTGKDGDTEQSNSRAPSTIDKNQELRLWKAQPNGSSICMQVQKGGEKEQKTADCQVVEITAWKNYCVLVGEQAGRSEEGKRRWNGNISIAVNEKRRGECKSWDRRIRWTRNTSGFNSRSLSL